VASPGGAVKGAPCAEQATAFEYLLNHQEAIRDALVAAIFDEYPRIRHKLIGERFIDPSEMPILEGPEQLKACIGLSTLHVLQVAKSGAAYMGSSSAAPGTTSTAWES
jgi:hypothetical protein